MWPGVHNEALEDLWRMTVPPPHVLDQKSVMGQRNTVTQALSLNPTRTVRTTSLGPFTSQKQLTGRAPQFWGPFSRWILGAFTPYLQYACYSSTKVLKNPTPTSLLEDKSFHSADCYSTYRPQGVAPPSMSTALRNRSLTLTEHRHGGGAGATTLSLKSFHIWSF